MQSEFSQEAHHKEGIVWKSARNSWMQVDKYESYHRKIREIPNRWRIKWENKDISIINLKTRILGGMKHGRAE